MGGIQYENLNRLARSIWEWCEQRNIWISASYINSEENIEADRESRRLEPEIEYMLSNSAFQKIVHKFGKPEIDLFASRVNKKCSRFVCWHEEPNCEAVGAFTISWDKLFFYAFPPFIIILRVLQKIKSEGACGIVVVPNWPSQPWFPLFRSMLVSEPIHFKPDVNLLISSNREPHPLWASLTLVAATLSGEGPS